MAENGAAPEDVAPPPGMNLEMDRVRLRYAWRVQTMMKPPSMPGMPPQRQRLLQFISMDGSTADTYVMDDELAASIAAALTSQPVPTASPDETRRFGKGSSTRP